MKIMKEDNKEMRVGYVTKIANTPENRDFVKVLRKGASPGVQFVIRGSNAVVKGVHAQSIPLKDAQEFRIYIKRDTDQDRSGFVSVEMYRDLYAQDMRNYNRATYAEAENRHLADIVKDQKGTIQRLDKWQGELLARFPNKWYRRIWAGIRYIFGGRVI